MVYNYAADGKSITSVTVSTTGNTCAVPVPVSFPGTATASVSGVVTDKNGTEPLISYTPMTGSSVTYTLGSAVPI